MNSRKSLRIVGRACHGHARWIRSADPNRYSSLNYRDGLAQALEDCGDALLRLSKDNRGIEEDHAMMLEMPNPHEGEYRKGYEDGLGSGLHVVFNARRGNFP